MDQLHTISPVEQIRSMIPFLSLALDREEFGDFLKLCHAEFQYMVTAHSPDLDAEMVWWDLSKEEFADACTMLDRHVRMEGTLRRIVSAPLLTVKEKNAIKSECSFLLCTTNNVGETRVVATGIYRDQFSCEDEDGVLLKNREVYVDTSMWSPGLHVPL